MMAIDAIKKDLLRFRSRNIPKWVLWTFGGTLLAAAGAAALGFVGLFAGLGATVALYVVWQIVRAPWVGVAVIACTLPFERFGALEISGFTIRASQLLALITIAVTLLYIIAGKVKLQLRGAHIPLSIFFIGAVFALFGAQNFFRGASTLVFMVFTGALAFLLPTLITSKRKLLVVLKALLTGAIVTAAFGLFQFAGDLAGLPQSITGLRDLYTKDVFGFPRIQSTALEPLYYANYLLLPLAVSIVVFIKKQRELLGYATILLPLALPVFVLTLSRAAYIAGILMVGILVLALFRRVVKPAYIVLGVFLILLTFFAVTYALSLTGEQETSIQAFTRQATDLFGGASFADRASTVSQAYELFRAHPFGIGPGNFGPAIAAHPLVQPIGGWLIVNNIYLEVLVEEGVVGFLGLAAFVAYVMFALVRAYRKRLDEFERGLMLAVAAALIGIFAQYMTFSILYIMHIWFALGLALILIKPFSKTR